ncbi:MAG: phosphoribosylformylglycinamidine synthase I [Chitinophagaceae bacterium]
MSRFGVVVFPGSNCDRDIMDALRKDLGQEVIPLWHKDRDLKGWGGEDCIILPGGFSFGDYLRCGALARFSPMMESVIEFAQKGGRVLGICNGFQILCEAGLLPGVLLRNFNQQFICKNIFLKAAHPDSILTRDLEQQVLRIPIAHGEGRYFADTRTLEDLWVNNQVMFRYCNDQGDYLESSNPNGSLDHIAGISNKKGNVFGMMPHPERASSEALGNTDGQMILKNLIHLS